MRIIHAKTLSGFARGTTGSTSSFTDVIHSLVKDQLSSYRPELHYMRGPGPKWRAKHRPWLRLDSEAVPRARSPSCRPSMCAIATRQTISDSGLRLQNANAIIPTVGITYVPRPQTTSMTAKKVRCFALGGGT
jgi:hypothetical protein